MLVVSLALSGIAIVVGRGGGDDDDDERATPATTTSTTSGEPPTADQLDAVVADLSAFVAAERELEFKEPVPVKLLADAEFATRVEQDAIDDLADLDEAE